jgi:hypothetical protein
VSDTKHITGNQDTMGGGGDLGTEPAAGGDLEFDPSTVDAAPGKKPTGILIMLLVLGLAVGMLFSMKTLTKVSGSAGKNTKVEGLVEDFLKAMGSDRSSGPDGGDDPIGSYNDVVNVLTDNYTKNQVKDLGRNPFEPIDGGGPVVVAPAGNAFERAANKLVLKSVMGNSIANFNGRIVRVGQVFPFDLGKNEGSVEFKLTAVGPDSATVAGVGGDPDAPFEQTIFLRRNN